MARTFKKAGQWWIDYRGADGRRHREKVGDGASHSLAEQVLAKRQSAAAEGKHFPGRAADSLTFGEVADKFWNLHGQYLASSSWRFLFDIIKAEFGSRKIGAINGGDVQRFYAKIAAPTREDQGQRYSTANKYLTLLKSIFNRAALWGDFQGINPCRGIKKGREAAHKLRYASVEEMDALLSKASPRLYPVLATSLLTGLRRGEVLGLRWENVSLERDLIYVLKTKSGHPRELPIPSKLRDLLIDLGPKKEGPVFGLPVITLRRNFAAALKAAGVFDLRWHDLRHSFASWFLMRTNDLPALQRLLGHASPSMTLRYAHLSRGHLASNVAAFESAIPVRRTAPGLPASSPARAIIEPVNIAPVGLPA